MDSCINVNGKIIGSDLPVIRADNRGFRYGDGVFETIRIKEGRILLAEYHFERFFSGLLTLQFRLPSFFTYEMLSGQVEELCKVNKHVSSAKVRLMAFRSDDTYNGKSKEVPDYIIQTFSILPLQQVLNDEGLRVQVFPHGRKAIDSFSNLKTNNYLLAVMAAKFAKSHQSDDCLILNSNQRICESSIANIFCIQNGRIYTPPLSEGCVAGVSRRLILEKMNDGPYPIEEKQMDIDFVSKSDEIFLTNAIYGIRYVESIGERQFASDITRQIYQRLIHRLL